MKMLAQRSRGRGGGEGNLAQIGDPDGDCREARRRRGVEGVHLGVILELKSVEKTSPSHRKQIQTYLKLSGRKLGYLLNFGADLMKHGITRAVNGVEE